MRIVHCPHCQNKVDLLVASTGDMADKFVAARAKKMLAGKKSMSVCPSCKNGFFWSFNGTIEITLEASSAECVVEGQAA